MSRKFKIVVLLSLFCLFINPTFAYSDISSVDSNYNEISFLQNFNLFEGDNFQPDKVVTKADLFYYLLKIDGFDVSKARKIQRTFSDLSPEMEPYFQRMYELGVFDFDDSTVLANPDVSLKKWNALNYFFRYHGIPVQRLLSNDEFIKSQIDGIYLNSMFAPYVDRGLRMGLIEPVNRSFGTFEDFTRRDLAILVYNYFAYLAGNSESGDIIINIPSSSVSTSLTQVEQFRIFEDVWNRANNDFLYADNVSKDKLIYGAIDGLVGALDDPYTTFLIPSQSQNFQDTLSDTYEGIGASLHVEGGKVIVVSPISDSPAEKAGVLPGDQIISVDGTNVTNLKLEEVVNLLKGEAGSAVKIEILRENKTLNFVITRTKVEVKYVTAEQTLDNILILRINTFGLGALNNIESIIKQIEVDNVNGVIIDVRNNPGGYLDQAVKIAELFLDEGENIVEIDYRNQSNQSFKSSKNGVFRNIPTVILINQGSASASEILAGALQVNADSAVIGQTSFGKGTVQELVNYSDKSSLKITTAQWKVPSEFGFRSIDKVGITPDFLVEITDNDRAIGNDAQLNKAIQVLRSN